MELKILVADDEAYIRLLLEQTLEDIEDEGVRLLFAENGHEALRLIQAERPQLVFLDVMMPLSSGFDVCAAIKKEMGWKDVFVVLLTAKGQEIDRQKGYEVGADLYLTKPFDPDSVLALARRQLNLEP